MNLREPMNTNIHSGNTMAGSTNDGGGRRRSRWKGPALFAALLLLIPLLGNQFVEGWNWLPRAFVLFGTLLFGLGLSYQLVTRNVDRIAYRAAVVMALAAGFMLFWGNFVQAADDVNPNPYAFRYYVALMVGIIGVVIARFRPDGMARALFAAALTQALVLVMVLAMRNSQVTSFTPAELRGYVGNAFFCLLFVGSALLFRKAGREESAQGAV
jgi:hypothetical protein